MVFTNKNIKRLGVFVFYDKEGIVDDYVLYLLDSLKKATEDMIIVSNSELVESSKKKFYFYTDKIRIRENIGLDAGAFKSVYDEYQEYFKTFDELILLNDTFYGPFTSFQEICKTMETKDIDFWGLSANFDSPDGFGYLPDKMIHSHIQTFFIVFRNNVLNSTAFNHYWQSYNIKKRKKFNDVVINHEITFTNYLEQAGFTWDVYTDLEKYHSKDLEENYNTYAYDAYHLIKNCRCPFIKRKNFVFEKKEVLFLADGEDNKKSLKYLEKEHLYDTSLIWKNLIRLYKTEDLYYGLNLNFIVEEQENSSKKCALIFMLEEEKFASLYVDILKKNHYKNLFVFTENEKIKKQLESKNIPISLKKDFNKEKFDYIGIVKDKYLKTQKIPLVYETNLKNIVLNGIENNQYINGILNIFDTNPYLGMLLIPQSLHGDYFGDIAKKENTISANFNHCWVKSELFAWDILKKDFFVQEYIKSMQKKYVAGKILNKKAVLNTLLNQEYILQKTYQILGNGNDTLNNVSSLLYFNSHGKRIIVHHILKLRLYNIVNRIYHKFFK